MTPDEARQRAVEAARGAFSAAYVAPVTADRCALTAAIAAYERALWQPIETAEADGTSVLVFERGGALADIAIDWHAPDGWLGKPTHWRPLPAEPGDGA
jgi:hypothetical protein